MTSILERLMNEEPTGRKNSPETMRKLRNWVKEHVSEIGEALRRGYSWKQITQACAENWRQSGIFEGVYLRRDENIVATCYYAVKCRDEKGISESEPLRMLLSVPLER